MTTVFLFSPKKNSSNVINYNYKSIFAIRDWLRDKKDSYNLLGGISVITSENFLTTTSHNQLAFITQEEFSQVKEELSACAQTFSNSFFLANSYLKTNNKMTTNYAYNSLQQWSAMPNKTLYPYFKNIEKSSYSNKQDQIRNTALNARFFPCNLFSLSCAFSGIDMVGKLKGMYLGNYLNKANSTDILNLDITNPNYNDSICVEQSGDYYANGYPNLFSKVGNSTFYHMIGHDAINLWEMNDILFYANYNSSSKQQLKTNNLIIQTDSRLDTSNVNARSFFNTLFSQKVTFSDTSDYSLGISITRNGLDPEQLLILTFLESLNSIIFADTKGFSFFFADQEVFETVGAIYKCDNPGNATVHFSVVPPQSKTQSLDDDSAQYTQYTI